jgi:hypothetical protein
MLQGEVPEKPVKRMNSHRRVEELTVTGVLAGMVTGSPVRSGEGVFLHVFSPRFLVAAGLG